MMDLVEELVEKAGITPPALAGGIEFLGRTQEMSKPTSRYGTKTLVHTLHFVVEIVGDADWLRFWPDEAALHLEPIDSEVSDDEIYEPIHQSTWSSEAAIRQWSLEKLVSRWYLTSERGRDELAVRVNVTPEELDSAADSGEIPTAVVWDWIEDIRPLVDAICAQIESFNEKKLRVQYARQIESLQKRLRGLHLTETEIEIPFTRMSQPMPLVEPAVGSVESPMLSEVLLGNHRLSAASFEDVVRTIRVWGSGVERYPKTYSAFNEDMISDTLCVTLNAALPGADREVYRKSGKTDLSIRADAVDNGFGSERVFVCESKIWRGKSSIRENVGQLFGYLDSRDTAAVLLYFVKNKDIGQVEQEIASNMQELNGFEGAGEGIAGWPLFHIEREGRKVRLLVACVHIY